MKFKLQFVTYAPTIFIIVFFSLWESGRFFSTYPSYLLPLPSQILATFLEFPNQFKVAFIETFSSLVIAYFITFFSSFIFAIFLFKKPILQKLATPFITFFQTVPIIAISPLLIIWFGLGQASVVAAAVVVSFFPQLNGFITGFQYHSTELGELFDWLKLSSFRRFIYLELPGALRSIFMSSRVALGLTLVGVIVGEFMSGSGLGSFIEFSRAQNRIDVMFACLLLITSLGVFLLKVLNGLETMLIRYRPFYH